MNPDENHNENSGKTEQFRPVGLRYRPCPSCGELILKDSCKCPKCFAEILADWTVKTANPQNDAGITGGRQSRFFLEKIDIESFSYPAFFFSDLWLSEKGMTKEAVFHFRFRLTTGIFYCLHILAVFESVKNGNFASPDQGASTAAAILWLFWLITFVIVVQNSWVLGKKAHEKLMDFCRINSPEDLRELQRNGRQLYLMMIFIPFLVFLILFLIALLPKL